MLNGIKATELFDFKGLILMSLTQESDRFAVSPTSLLSITRPKHYTASLTGNMPAECERKCLKVSLNTQF